MVGSGDLPGNIAINCNTVNLVVGDGRGSTVGEPVNSGTDAEAEFRTQHRVPERLVSALHSASTNMPGFKWVELVSFSREARQAGNTRIVWMANVVWTATRHHAPRFLARAMELPGYQRVHIAAKWWDVVDEAHHIRQQMDEDIDKMIDEMNASDDE